MELEKTTIMSILVGFAGLLAELVFRESLTGSVLGVVLSVVLAVIILCCAYFAIDGLQKSFSAVHKREENRKREYDEKLFRLLNKKLSDQIKLEKGIYSLLVREAKKGSVPGSADGSGEYWKELAESIDNSSVKAAKLVAKYNQKDREESDRISGQNAEEMLQEIRSMGNQLQMLNGGLQELASRVVAMVEESSREPETASEEFFQPIEEADAPSLDEVDGLPAEDEDVLPLEETKEADELLAAGPEEPGVLPLEDMEEMDGLLSEETDALDLDEADDLLTDALPEAKPDETDTLLSEETVEEDRTEDEIPVPAEQPMTSQGEEEVDVNRMMEELFNESIGEGQETAPETAMENSGVEGEFSPQADGEEQEAGVQSEETGEPDMEAVLATLADSEPSDAETALGSGSDDTDSMSEEELDTLLSGLLPEPEPLEEAVEPEPLEEPAEPEPEEKKAALTALDMLLSHQKAEQEKPETSEKESAAAEPVFDETAASETTDQAEAPELSEITETEDSVEASGTTETSETAAPATEEDPNKAMSPDDIAALLASLDS